MLLDLQAIFREVFEDPTLQLSESFSMETNPDWDSVATIQIILETEARFKVHFTTDEVASVTSVQDLLDMLAVHTKQP
jgi:acyl carrier protein